MSMGEYYQELKKPQNLEFLAIYLQGAHLSKDATDFKQNGTH